MFYIKQPCWVSRMDFSTTGKAIRIVIMSAKSNNRPLTSELFRYA